MASGNLWCGEVLFSFLLLCAQLYYLNILGCCALHFRKSGTTWWQYHLCTSDIMINACSEVRCSQNAGICDTILGHSWLCMLQFLLLYFMESWKWRIDCWKCAGITMHWDKETGYRLCRWGSSSLTGYSWCQSKPRSVHVWLLPCLIDATWDRRWGNGGCGHLGGLLWPCIYWCSGGW